MNALLKTIPDEISYDDAELSIKWKDGTSHKYSLLMLRKQCPCANCRGGHSADSVRTTEHITEARVVSWKKVGRYALQLTWSDNHDLGMYTYDELRRAGETHSDYDA